LSFEAGCSALFIFFSQFITCVSLIILCPFGSKSSGAVMTKACFGFKVI
jgi:hypothetical protein